MLYFISRISGGYLFNVTGTKVAKIIPLYFLFYELTYFIGE